MLGMDTFNINVSNLAKIVYQIKHRYNFIKSSAKFVEFSENVHFRKIKRYFVFNLFHNFFCLLEITLKINLEIKKNINI